MIRGLDIAIVTMMLAAFAWYRDPFPAGAAILFALASDLFAKGDG